MKATLKKYIGGQFVTSEVFKTKKSAEQAKKLFLQSFTVHNRVKQNVQAIVE